MIEYQIIKALQKIIRRLEGYPINWVVTGSLGMALQGIPVEINDIDIQTDKHGAYVIERLFAEDVVNPVRFSESEKIRSYLGMFEINGIKVEVMGNIQKHLKNKKWEKPVKVERYRHWMKYNKMRIPVFSLQYEYQAYLKLGRFEKAEMLRNWLEKINAIN